MQLSFSYNKAKVIQALRYHFVQRPEIRLMLVLVNVFAIIAAILFYAKKIRPEPFLLGSLVWMFLMAAFWYFLPNSIYKKSATFQDQFIMNLNETAVVIETERGEVVWDWRKFTNFFESPHFFHLYFNTKSFFLVPKENISTELQHELRGLLNRNIKK
ncbi:MAG: YcxB family protein [Bacteroidetes bacterium]|nr:YcxB family protein [Bacteroidota bacterium]